MRRQAALPGRRRGAVLLATTLALIESRCATAPKATPALRRVAANPPAIVEGVVRDESGRAVPGIAVRGIPGEKDVPWSPVARTGCDGRFRLTLAAPASYSFVLLWGGTTVITPDPRDPSRTHVAVSPGATVEGVGLVFLAAGWRDAAIPAAAEPAACPESPVYNSSR